MSRKRSKPIVREAVSLYEAKTHLSRLVDAAAGGSEIVIMKSGRPTARLVPLEDALLRCGLAEGPARGVRGQAVNLLLDTHVLIWWDEGSRLRPDALAAIQDAAEVYVSVGNRNQDGARPASPVAHGLTGDRRVRLP